jgi:hypothetical protein
VLIAALIAMSLLVTFVTPRSASACSGGGCAPGYFVPGNGATIPENAPALLWGTPTNFSRSASVLPELKFQRVDAAEVTDVNFQLELEQVAGVQRILPEALVAGARYRLEVSGDCATPAVEFKVAAVAPLPADLGTVTLSTAHSGDVTVATGTGSCDTQLPAAMIDVNVRLSREAKPWAALLQYTTRVDDKVWSPSWSLGGDPYGFQGAQNLLFVECPKGDPDAGDPGAYHQGLKPGAHRVRIEAVLPGMDGVLKTPTQNAQLSCAAASSGCNVERVRRGGAHGYWVLCLGVAWLLVRRRDPRL